MKAVELDLPGVRLFKPTVYGDERGFFLETWNLERYRRAGLAASFVQSNASRSKQGVLRGLHFQNPKPQGKLVFVLEGEVFDVAVDIRRNSPHFGRWVGVYLSASNCHQLYIPPGFAHGFCVTSETALFCYFCTDSYDASAETSIRWNDPTIGIEWPIAAPNLSEKDRAATLLQQVTERLPEYP